MPEPDSAPVQGLDALGPEASVSAPGVRTPDGLPPLVQFVGPTASGKSSLAVQVAEALTASGRPTEIVNADSMVVYRGMDIGTAKPSRQDRERVPHHLVDIMDVTQTASVAQMQQLARHVIADLRARGTIALLVGGSALYSRAITDHFEFPATDPLVRAQLEDELDRFGSEALHARLASLDPAAAEAILPGNGRRVVRALEVLQTQGSLRPALPQWTYALANTHTFGLELDRALMDTRIEERVDAMWREGLVDEVRGLVEVGLRDGLTASRALGYRQVLAMLDGACTEAEAIDQTKAGTRRFARKQLGWYRRDHRITWWPHDIDLDHAVGQIAQLADRAECSARPDAGGTP